MTLVRPLMTDFKQRSELTTVSASAYKSSCLLIVQGPGWARGGESAFRQVYTPLKRHKQLRADFYLGNC